MKNRISKNTFYALYDANDMPVMVGNRKEVAEYIGMSNDVFKSELCKFRKGKVKLMKRLYKVFAYEMDEEMEACGLKAKTTIAS